ncbi:MAG: hypothetical protein WDN75_20030 [Bacteroidota bacterium]
MKMRWRSAKKQFTPAIRNSIITALFVFIFSGCCIYYNTNVLNSFMTTTAIKGNQAEYEKQFKKYESLVQPKITSVNLLVELYPSRRSFTAKGFYYLRNNSNTPIKDIHVLYPSRNSHQISGVRFNRPATLKKSVENTGYYIYELTEMLPPGDSFKNEFRYLLCQSWF